LEKIVKYCSLWGISDHTFGAGVLLPHLTYYAFAFGEQWFCYCRACLELF